MKKLIFLLVSLLFLSQAQELVTQSWSGSYNTGVKFAKEYRRPEWNNLQDFAIYGYLKINSSLPKDLWSTVFHFTSQTDANFSDSLKVGDRVLGLFYQQNYFNCHSYNGASDTNAYKTMTIDDKDQNKWVFFYLAYGSSQKKAIHYFELPYSGKKTNYQTNISHSTSSFYKIHVGQSAQYKYFQGEIFRLSLIAGNQAYRESNFLPFQNINPLASLPNCPVVFNQCAFTGTAINICENVSPIEKGWVKSVYVPQGKFVNVYDSYSFSGTVKKTYQSIECIQ